MTQLQLTVSVLLQILLKLFQTPLLERLCDRLHGLQILLSLIFLCELHGEDGSEIVRLR